MTLLHCGILASLSFCRRKDLSARQLRSRGRHGIVGRPGKVNASSMNFLVALWGFRILWCAADVQNSVTTARLALLRPGGVGRPVVAGRPSSAQ